MNSYICTARTNEFRILDRDKFEDWLASVSMQELSVVSTDDPLCVSLTASDGEAPGFWIEYEDDDGNKKDLLEELARHLADGEIAVLMEGGGWSQSVTGYAIAVRRDDNDPKGFQKIEVSLYDIFPLVESEWGVSPRPMDQEPA